MICIAEIQDQSLKEKPRYILNLSALDATDKLTNGTQDVLSITRPDVKNFVCHACQNKIFNNQKNQQKKACTVETEQAFYFFILLHVSCSMFHVPCSMILISSFW